MKYLIKVNKTAIGLLFILTSCVCFSQTADTLYLPLDASTTFVEGIYTGIKDIQSNDPSYKVKFLKRGTKVFFKNEEGTLVELSADNTYGYSFNNKIYLSSEGQFWRCVNVGRLTQFSEIKTNSYIDYDPYTNNAYQRNVNVLRHSFLDINTGEFKDLNYKNLKPYIEKEPGLKSYIKRNNKAKYKELILILKAYNQLNPSYITIYE